MNQKIQDPSSTFISTVLCEWWSELVIYIQSYTALCSEEALNSVICAYELSVPYCFLEEIDSTVGGNRGWVHSSQASSYKSSAMIALETLANLFVLGSGRDINK